MKVLFLCEHNSARSQIAEAFLKQIGGEQFEVESAGLEVKPLDTLAVEVMKKICNDISEKKTQSVFDLYKKGRLYHYVITVCDKSVSEKCPIFPNTLEQLHWPFDDPAKFTGSLKNKLEETIKIRDDIKEKNFWLLCTKLDNLNISKSHIPLFIIFYNPINHSGQEECFPLALNDLYSSPCSLLLILIFLLLFHYFVCQIERDISFIINNRRVNSNLPVLC